LKRYAAAFGLGVAAVGGFAPFYVFPLAILALALLLALIEQRGVRDALGIGYAFGLGHFAAGVSWVYVSLHDFGAMPAPAAVGVTLLFCGYLALFPALAAGYARRIESPVLRRLLAFPGAWIVMEWARGWLFTGFPWLALGYSQAPHSALAGLAPLLGLYGVGLATALSAGLLVHAFAGRSWRASWRVLALLAVLWVGAGALRAIEWTQPHGSPVNVSLLQGNIAQSMKWRPEQLIATLRLYEQLIRDSDAQLIVLPETALPLFLQDVPEAFLAAVAHHARDQGADVLIGLPERGAGNAYFNSVVSVGASPPQVYRKSHLVPFGEFIPLRPLLAPIVESLAIPLTDFSRGSIDQQPLAVAGQRVAVNICYEDAFGEEIIRQLPQATLLVNVSNVAWFGRSIAPMQHLQIAQMRALETGRPMLRATNTGMTAAIDTNGRVLVAAETFKTETVNVTVQGYSGATPYVRYGNPPAIALAAAGMLAGLVPVLNRRRSRA
jgi:apolipoprotein N-acyltransferase